MSTVASDEHLRTTGDRKQTPGSPVFESLLENSRNRRHLGDRLADADARVDADFLGDVVRHGPVLELLLDEPLDRGEIEDRLGVSRATSHRFTRWIDDEGLAEKVEGRYRLTGRGEVLAEEVLRFEANVRIAHRLAPLLDAVCEDHQEFVVEPFLDATVTVAEPAAPYRPVERLVSLVEDSDTLRGFGVTRAVPPVADVFHRELFEATDAEVVCLPPAAESLFGTAPERAREAVDAGRLRFRTREDLPYGLAIFDDRVGIGGYDESTGQLTVFVDTDDPIAREWAERVYESVRADSEPWAVEAGD